MQSEVAQTIAKELHAVITPEEKQLIEKTPTVSLTAYDFYQRGEEELIKFQIDNSNKQALNSSKGWSIYSGQRWSEPLAFPVWL